MWGFVIAVFGFVYDYVLIILGEQFLVKTDLIKAHAAKCVHSP